MINIGKVTAAINPQLAKNAIYEEVALHASMGTTSEKTSMQPYITVYMWRRIE